MPMQLNRLVDIIQPEKTVLLFGAGSSIPSGAPSVDKLKSRLSKMAGVNASDYTLAEIASFAEKKNSRKDLIESMRASFRGLRPTRGLVNLPLYGWKSLFTTNYDDLIEQCYRNHSRDIVCYSSDFDFTNHASATATKLFKLHGTIEKDICDGYQGRLILTDTDYDHTESFRNALYDRLKGDIAGNHLVIIGQSLADQHIKDIATRAASISANALGPARVSLLMYTNDPDRAGLFESRGFTVCFGGIDEFFAEMARLLPTASPALATDDPLDAVPSLRPITIDVAHESAKPANVSSMFNGWPATHADVIAGLTFERTVSEDISLYLKGGEAFFALLLGATGVGKTTAARQAVQRFRPQGLLCWEHQSDHYLEVHDWVDVAKALQATGRTGVLVIDDAHSNLQQLNDLVDALASTKTFALKLICISTRNHWMPRIKSPYIYKLGREFKLGVLDTGELDRLLSLIDSKQEIRNLVENTFTGFSRYEKRRRLEDRCASEMFVCLKNIFASEKFDDIILREYAGLQEQYQDIYRYVAVMENAGIRVHRQLIMRLTGMLAGAISSALLNLTDIVLEYPINEREGIYGWRGRHSVIVGIIAKYKFPDVDKLEELFERVIDNISPTYEIEVRSLVELCNYESGLSRLPDKRAQNKLLRKMMSVVPGERVPRHRLIRNLVRMGEFEEAETEIRIFEHDFGRDGPVARYKVTLLTARATKTKGILEEDRLAILEEANALAAASVQRFQNNKSLLGAYCEVGIEIGRRTGKFHAFDAAISELKAAEVRLGDPDISRLIAGFESRVIAQSSDPIGSATQDNAIDPD